MKPLSYSKTVLFLMGALLLCASTASAQPASPSPVSTTERTITDLLYFPFACLPQHISSQEEAQEQLTALFGSYEIVNGNIGLHANDAYHFTYRGVPIGVSDWDWTDNRQWYQFYFSQKKDANIFYNQLAADIKKAGIPLTPDKIYGGLSNRRRPVSIFRWVYLTPPALVKEADHSNLDREDVVGMYKVELGVYKRKKK